MHTLSQVDNLRKKLYVYHCHMCHTCHVLFHDPANYNLQKKNLRIYAYCNCHICHILFIIHLMNRL
jgi:hypothetical protein